MGVCISGYRNVCCFGPFLLHQLTLIYRDVEFTAGIMVCCMPTTTTVLKLLYIPTSAKMVSYMKRLRLRSKDSTVTQQKFVSPDQSLSSFHEKGFDHWSADHEGGSGGPIERSWLVSADRESLVTPNCEVPAPLPTHPRGGRIFKRTDIDVCRHVEV